MSINQARKKAKAVEAEEIERIKQEEVRSLCHCSWKGDDAADVDESAENRELDSLTGWFVTCNLQDDPPRTIYFSTLFQCVLPSLLSGMLLRT